MRYYHLYIGCTLTLILLFACHAEKEGFEWVEVSELYSVYLPTQLQLGYDLHDFASLQCYNPHDDFYLIGIEDAKANFGEIRRGKLSVGDYFDFVESTAFAPADSFHQLHQQKLEINQLSAETGDYFARMTLNSSSYELYYRIAVYESDSHFFQLILWTPYGQHEEYIPWMDSITQSFQLLHETEDATP